MDWKAISNIAAAIGVVVAIFMMGISNNTHLGLNH